MGSLCAFGIGSTTTNCFCYFLSLLFMYIWISDYQIQILSPFHIIIHFSFCSLVLKPIKVKVFIKTTVKVLQVLSYIHKPIVGSILKQVQVIILEPKINSSIILVIWVSICVEDLTAHHLIQPHLHQTHFT